MAAHLVPVTDVFREALTQFIENPFFELVIILTPVIPEGSFQLAVGLAGA
ncbi:MAG TPA: hypothetical protein VIG62_22065 [Blastocatellia bacterium]|jgi:hypothetical protein